MDDLAGQLALRIAQDDFSTAISLAEKALGALPATAFHQVIGRDLLQWTEEAANYMTHFFAEAEKNIAVKALYFEMNAFGINPDMWFFDSFALSFCGDPDYPDDADWLADYEFMMPNMVFQIGGYEDLQASCKDYLAHKRYVDKVQRNAKDAVETIVTIRFIELLAHAVKYAQEKDFPWAAIPIFGAAHGETLLYRARTWSLPSLAGGACGLRFSPASLASAP